MLDCLDKNESFLGLRLTMLGSSGRKLLFSGIGFLTLNKRCSCGDRDQPIDACT